MLGDEKGWETYRAVCLVRAILEDVLLMGSGCWVLVVMEVGDVDVDVVEWMKKEKAGKGGRRGY